MITDGEIDDLHDVIETLNLAEIVLSNGNITDKTAGSISWLLGTMQSKIRNALHILEETQTLQQKQVQS